MTVIRPNSISGVTSITAQGDALTLHSSDGTLLNELQTNINASSGVSTVANLVVVGVTTVAAGTTAAPSISPSGDSNTGIFFPSADTIAFGEGGVESMRIDSSGRVGIGTTSPARLLEVRSAADVLIKAVSTDPGAYVEFADNNTTQDVRLGAIGNALCFDVNSERARIDSSGRLLVGISTKTLNHPIQVVAASDANAIAVIGRVADDIGEVSFYENDQTTVLGELQYRQDHLNLRHRVGDIRFATGGVLERMRIGQGGNVDIGTANTPNGLGLQVRSNSDNDFIGSFYVINSNAALAACVAAFATATNDTSTSNLLIRFAINSYGSSSGAIATNGTGQCTFVTVSDSRLKENIVDLPSQWENIKNLRPVEFDFIESEGGEHQIGFIAQEIQTVYPDAVGSQPLSFNEEENAEEYLTVGGWSKTEARLVKALQEAIAKIETLEAKVAALESA